MELIGHRGCGDHNPENTVRAVAAASERLPAVEIDLRRCRSGQLVAFHDERVDELTDGSGAVGDLDWKSVRDLRVLGSDERVPRISEVLDAVPESVTLQIELKEPGLHEDLRRILDDRNRRAVRISSFSAPVLAEIHQSSWSPATGLLFGGAVEANLALARSLDCRNLHPHVEDCLQTDIVDRAHGHGFDVFAWGLSDVADLPLLCDRGVEGVTTDTWDVPEPGGGENDG